MKVIPKDFKQMIEQIKEQKEAGLSDEEALMYAFEASTKQKIEPSAAASSKEAVAQ